MSTLLSIVTVCFNSEKTIECTLKSVLEQLDDDMEYIVVDGASKDGTLSIVKKYMESYPGKINLFSERDRSAPDAVNKGVKLSSGRWIIFIHSDDYLEKGILSRVKADLIKYDKYDLVCGRVNAFVTINGDIYSCVHKPSLSARRVIHPLMPGMFYKRDVFEKVGELDIRYKYVNDGEHMLRMLSKGCRVKLIDKIITNFRLTGVSHTKFMGFETFEIARKYNYGLNAYILFFEELYKYFKRKVYLKIIYRNNLGLHYAKIYNLTKVSKWNFEKTSESKGSGNN